jgi:citrate synthase
MSESKPQTPESVEVRKGLEGIIAGETAICQVDGQGCQLIYRGYNIDELVGRASYEETSYLLLQGSLPTKTQLAEWSHQLESQRSLDSNTLSILNLLPAHGQPMALLRTLVSAMGLFDAEAEDESIDAIRRKAVRTIARMGTLVAAIGRRAKGQMPLPPKTGLSHAANFLYMLNGEVPSVEQAQALDLYFVLLAEHGFNASTFAARVVTGTRADYYSAISGAIGTLKGPLHGSAGERAMETVLEIGAPEKVEAFVQKTLSNHQRFMGFGHRVYKGEDPRGKHLKAAAQHLAQKASDPQLFAISERMQAAVFAAKALHINVDFYAAPLLHYVGIATDLFTTMFATSRIAGWGAHVIEQSVDNRLIRPLARYVGPMDLKYVPIGQRSAPHSPTA